MLSSLMRHVLPLPFWSSPRPGRQDSHSEADNAEDAQQHISDTQPPSRTEADAPAASTSVPDSAASLSSAPVVEDADDPMDISFMATPASTAAMPITPFLTQPAQPASSRPSPVPFRDLSRPSLPGTGATATARRAVPPVPLFAATASKASETAPAAAAARGRTRGRFEAPDRDEEKEAADERPAARQPFTVRVEDEAQNTTFQFTAAAVEESKETPSLPQESATAAPDARKRKRDSNEMMDIDDEDMQTTPSQPQPTRSPQRQPTQTSSASPASATSSDDDSIPMKKLKLDDTPPASSQPTTATATAPASTSPAAAAPRQRESLTSRFAGVALGWYSSLHNAMHGVPSPETVLQAGMDSMGLKEEETEAEERKDGGGARARMDEIKRLRSDKSEQQQKERRHEKAQRSEQGEERSRTHVKQQRAPQKRPISHDATIQPPQHTPLEPLHTDNTHTAQQPHPPEQQQHAADTERKEHTDRRDARDERETTRTGPKAQVKENAEEMRRKRMMQGVERRKQGREHALLEKRDMQRRREEEARREAERIEEEAKETRRREDEQRRRQAELLEQARALQREREEREEVQRQKAAEEQRARERAQEERDKEAQLQRERERERQKDEREQQQQQRQRAATKENTQNQPRPSPPTSTDDTPRRSTRLSSMHTQHQQHHHHNAHKPTTTPAPTVPAAAPAADNTISARLHARRLEKDEHDRLQQAEQAERERLTPHVERTVRARARARDGVGLVREFAPQLLEGKGRVVGGEVRKVLRRCMALYHPDKWQTRSLRERVESEQVFAVIQRAYEECNS